MYKYMNLLESKRYITTSEFLTIMEISVATFKRDLDVLRNRFDVPIVYERDLGAYKLDLSCGRKRLPGVWFSPEELTIIHSACKDLSNASDPKLANSIKSLCIKLERIGFLND